MKIKALSLHVVILAMSLPAFAGERSSDAAIKQRLLGYWKSPRHGYHIKSDGIMYMCPRAYCTTTNRWNVKDGRFYQDGDAYQIVTLTNNKFVYRDSRGTYILNRGSKDEVDPPE